MTWPTVKLGDVLEEAKSGFASGSKEETGIAQVRMNNVTRDGALVWNDVRRVPAPKNIEKLLLSSGDVLFNSTNSPNLVGKSAFFNGFDEPLTFSNHFLRLRARADVLDGSFLARCLVDEFQRGTFENLCKRWVNQAAVSRDDLFALEIPLPPLEEQKRLAAILDRAAELRRMRLQVLAGLDELAQSLFLELFGDPAMNPKGWDVVRLGDVITANYGKALKAENRVSVGQFDVFGSNGYVGKHNETLYDNPTIVIGRKGSVGAVTYAPKGGWTIDTAYYVTMKNQEVILDWRYLLFALESAKLESLTITTSIPGLNRDALYSKKIPLPPLPLQQQFAQQIEELEAIKVRARASLSELDALFASLQARAFAGELSGVK